MFMSSSGDERQNSVRNISVDFRAPCWCSSRQIVYCGLSLVQTDATLLARGSCRVRLHVAKDLTGCATTLNNTQQHATGCALQRQHVTCNNFGSCWPTILRPLARGFRECFMRYILKNNNQLASFLIAKLTRFGYTLKFIYYISQRVFTTYTHLY